MANTGMLAQCAQSRTSAHTAHRGPNLCVKDGNRRIGGSRKQVSLLCGIQGQAVDAACLVCIEKPRLAETEGLEPVAAKQPKNAEKGMDT
eukprot:1158815-Pelagomonas_calceolata.AAC.9